MQAASSGGASPRSPCRACRRRCARARRAKVALALVLGIALDCRQGLVLSGRSFQQLGEVEHLADSTATTWFACRGVAFSSRCSLATSSWSTASTFRRPIFGLMICSTMRRFSATCARLVVHVDVLGEVAVAQRGHGRRLALVPWRSPTGSRPWSISRLSRLASFRAGNCSQSGNVTDGVAALGAGLRATLDTVIQDEGGARRRP